MTNKARHKELKKEVNKLEKQRSNDRSFSSWQKMKEMKKLKLQVKEKLHEIELR